MPDTDPETIAIEAATFRRLRDHLMRDRLDVRNIDLIIGAGFCREQLVDWYREAAEARGITMTGDEARETVYGMPLAQWQAQQQREAAADPRAASDPDPRGAR